jgi:hypothetical protein
MLQLAEAPVAGAFLRRTLTWGTQWGQLDGPEVSLSSRSGDRLFRAGRLRRPDHLAVLAFGPTDLPAFGEDSRPETIVTWLILPVVICLSQRLSHACLSISNLYCETANGSLNQLSFI